LYDNGPIKRFEGVRCRCFFVEFYPEARPVGKLQVPILHHRDTSKTILHNLLFQIYIAFLDEKIRDAGIDVGTGKEGDRTTSMMRSESDVE
jgi:hypothetical protein